MLEKPKGSGMENTLAHYCSSIVIDKIWSYVKLLQEYQMGNMLYYADDIIEFNYFGVHIT